MIDEARTLELFGYTSDEVGAWSRKPIVVVCDECGKYRIIKRKQYYRELCTSCSQNGRIVSDETKQRNSEAMKRRPPVTDETRKKMRESNKCNMSKNSLDTHRRHLSAAKQGIPYDGWESFAKDQPYCPHFNEACRESNREKYGRHCFLTGAPESANVNKSGKMSKQSVHHIDMDKMQGCNGTRWKLVPMLMGLHGRMHNETWLARIEYLLEHVWYIDGIWSPDALC